MFTRQPAPPPRAPINAITCRSRIGFDPQTGPWKILRIPEHLTLERAYSLVDRGLADIGELKAPLAMPDVPSVPAGDEPNPNPQQELLAVVAPTQAPPTLAPVMKKTTQPRL